MNLSKLKDDKLDAELTSRVEALELARAAYAAKPNVTTGRALYKARVAAGDAQAEQNERHGGPPTQFIGQ